MLRLLLASQLLAISFAQCPPAQPICPSGWYYSSEVGSCYKVVSKEGGIDSDSANTLCKEAGGQLASIHSAEENRIINELANTRVNVTTGYHTLVGGVRRTGAGLKEFTWTDGTPFDYQFWHSPPQPDNRGGIQNCLQVYTSNQAAYPTAVTRWDDAECNAKYINAICRISLGGGNTPVNPTTLPSTTNCPTGWVYQSSLNGCYKFMTQTGGVTFDEATGLCQSAGGQLTSIHSAEENQVVIDLSAETPAQVNTRYQTLIGGQRTNGVWKWTDGSAFDYKYFANTDDAKQCLQIWSTNSPAIDPIKEYKQWDDASCTAKYRGAVCKIQLDPPSTTAPQLPCPTGWTHGEAFKSCYKSIYNVTFTDADTQCKAMGSQLASVHSNGENVFIIAFTKLGRNISDYEAQPLLGGKRTGTDAKDWSWTDGTPFDYLNWVDGEPNNADGKESCLQVNADPWGTSPPPSRPPPPSPNYMTRWNDYPCDVRYRIALCKQPAKY